MGSTTTKTTIANSALQILGYKPIGSINDNDRGARAINRAYPSVFLDLLRSSFWSFAIKRAQLAPLATKPIFGKANYFPLPGDFVMIAPPDQSSNYQFTAMPGRTSCDSGYNDWQIENNNDNILSIATDDEGPIRLRYISSNVIESIFDPSFAEAFAAALAVATCEELTQSNTKLAAIQAIYKDTMELAKKRNAFEKKPVLPPVDTYILARA